MLRDQGMIWACKYCNNEELHRVVDLVEYFSSEEQEKT